LGGRREAHEIAKNLVALLEASPEHRKWMKEFLWQSMLHSIYTPAVKLRFGRVQNPNLFEVAITTLAMMGEAERPLLGLFGYC
jgi:hypothetical protein